MNQRYCLALDLKDDPALIAAYEEYHRSVWPEVLASIRESGITEMEIYRTGTRLFMIMETSPSFSFAEKAAADQANQVVQDWEAFVGKCQQPVPWAASGEKWKLMDNIFRLSDQGAVQSGK
jgi:L-rhamnose mutarotase